MKFNMKHVACILHTVPIIIFCSGCIWSPYFIKKIPLLVTKVMGSWVQLLEIPYMDKSRAPPAHCNCRHCLANGNPCHEASGVQFFC